MSARRGAVRGGVVIATIVQVTLPGFVLGAVLMALANRHASRSVARARWRKLVVFGVIVHAVLGAAAIGRDAVAALVALVLTVGTVELTGAWRRMSQPKPARTWVLYTGAALSCLWVAGTLAPEQFAALFIVTAAFDGFSQVVGQWLGRHKLAPRVSPGKTVEGMLGGLVAAGAVAALTHRLLGVDSALAASLGVATGLAGLVGDLGASWVKRRAGLKDYSALLPEQGGMLDRFDSLLGALVLVGVPMGLASSATRAGWAVSMLD
jgi:phosphatidate cytidylyltransferase